MAVFGLRGRPELASAQALDAARRMALALEIFNAQHHAELKTPFRIGIGIHFGPAIVGEMGFPPALSLTAIGDTVNTASQLESATKEVNCQLLVSETVARGAELPAGSRTALRDHACAAANRCWWRSRSTMRPRCRHRHERDRHDASPFPRADPAAHGSRLSARRAGQRLLVDRAAPDPAGDRFLLLARHRGDAAQHGARPRGAPAASAGRSAKPACWTSSATRSGARRWRRTATGSA